MMLNSEKNVTVLIFPLIITLCNLHFIYYIYLNKINYISETDSLVNFYRSTKAYVTFVFQMNGK